MRNPNKNGKIFKLGILLFLFNTSISNAQFIKFQMDSVVKGTVANYVNFNFSDDDGGRYLWTSNSPKSAEKPICYFSHYDKNHRLLKSVKQLKTKGKIIVDLIEIQENIFLFSYSFSGSKAIFFVQKMNKQTLTPGEPEQLATMDKNLKGDQTVFGNRYFIISSQNKEYFALMGTQDKKMNLGLIYQVAVFNNRFSVKWQKDVSLPFSELNFQLNYLNIGNNGNIYLLAKGNEFILTVISEYGAIAKSDTIEFSKKFIENICCLNDETKNEIVFAGLYSDKKENAMSVKGALSFKMNMDDLSFSKINYYEFDTKTLENMFASKLNLRKDELRSYHLDSVILKKDGGFYLVGEQQWTVTYPSSNSFSGVGGSSSEASISFSSGGTTHTVTHFDDFLIVSLSSDLTYNWTTIVPRRTYPSYNYSSASFVSLTYNNNLYLIFNQSTWVVKVYKTDGKLPDVNEPTEEDKNAGWGNASVIAVKVTPEGERYSQKLWDKDTWHTEYNKLFISPESCKQTSENEMFIYCSQISRNQSCHITIIE